MPSLSSSPALSGITGIGGIVHSQHCQATDNNYAVELFSVIVLVITIVACVLKICLNRL